MSISTRALRASSAVIVAMVLTSIGLAAPANGADLVWYKSTIISKSRVAYIDYSHRIDFSCNLPCSFTSSASVTRSIGLTAGLTRSGVAATLGISSATTATVSTSCDVPKTASKTYLWVFPEGYKYTYKVKKQTFDIYNNLVKTEYVTLTAFDPKGIHCAAV